MSWFAGLRDAGHLGEAVFHVNGALDWIGRGAPEVDIARSLADALNKVQTEWRLQSGSEDAGEVRTFQTMLCQALGEQEQSEFLRSAEVAEFVRLEPRIMNHDVLRRGGYRPGVEIDPKLAKRSAEVHRKMQSALTGFLDDESAETRTRLMARLAELLYIVRSNIAHGEKTPYGVDAAKSERDRQVSEAVIPVQLQLVNLLLDRPDERLVVYGTLAPGEPNHAVVEGAGGFFTDCTIEGHIETVDGLPYFTWRLGEQLLTAQLLSSPLLPRKWAELDRFEGAGYKRWLIPASTKSGIRIANVYVDAKAW